MSIETPDIALPSSRPAARPPLKTVALPSEHGGWGLTLEPAFLGLVVAPTAAGGLLAAAALVAFVARTPVKLALVDRWRRRRLDRTRLAERVAAVELALLAVLAGLATALADGPFWIPVVLALPLMGVELWFDMRSRGRRLVPELAGTVGIGSVAAAIVLAGGGSGRLAVGLWLVVAARAVASLPFVRVQLMRGRGRPASLAASDGAQAAGLALAVAALVLDDRLLAGLVAIAALAVVHLVGARRDPPVPRVLGLRQMFLGLAVTLATGLGAALS